jgi:RNA polymerase sigma-70 factor (ECF subfamily)
VELPDTAHDGAVMTASLTDPSRFGAIFDRHATVLHRYLIRRVGVDEADGMVGELFLIAFERRASFDVTARSARPWLYGIATNLVARRQRAEARRLRATARLAGRTPRSSMAADADIESLDAADRWQQVADALAAIPAPERDALLLHAWEGLSYDEVADALGIPVGTVRSRLNRARRHVRELETTNGEGSVRITS